MDARRLKFRIGIIIGAFFLQTGCATTDLPSVDESSFEILEDEQRLFNRSREAIAFFERSGLIYQEQELDAYLNQIYRKLLPPNLEASHLKPRIKVIDQSETNAFALSNGQLYISSSMLTLMDNEAQLAAVIAHEMTHVHERHALKVKRSTANKAAFFQSVSLAGPLAAFGAVSSISGYSRAVEKEADRGGMEALLENNYDLREAAIVYQNILQFNQDEDIREPFFFSTHPALKSRMKSAQAFMDEHPQKGESIKNEDVFKEKTKKVTWHTIGSWFQAGKFVSAERIIEQYIQDFPNDAEGFFLKGEFYRQRQDQENFNDRRDKEADYAQALEAFDTAIAKNNQFAPAHKGRGIALLGLKRTAEAKKSFQKYLDLNPNAKDYMFLKAVVEDQE